MEDPGEDVCLHLELPRGFKPTGCLHVPNPHRLQMQEADFLGTGRTAARPDEQALLNLRATALLLSLIQSVRTNQHPPVSAGNIHVNRAENYIRNRFATIQSINEVSVHAGISADHLRHRFKALHGKSLVTFLKEIRIERAQSLLLHSRLPLKEISRLCGFRDEHYFSAVFARNQGIPPGHYRKTHEQQRKKT